MSDYGYSDRPGRRGFGRESGRIRQPARLEQQDSQRATTAAHVGDMAAGSLRAEDGNFDIDLDAERILLGAASDPATGIGIFLGLDGADYEFRAGDPGGDNIHWDGSSLNITGSLTVGSSVPWSGVSDDDGNKPSDNADVTADSAQDLSWLIASGIITAGNLDIDASNEQIRIGSASAPLTGAGIFLGKDGVDYEFRVGDPAGQYFHWDGSTLTLVGEIVGTSNIVNGAITTSKINALAVTASELAANAVTNAKIAAGAVDTPELATDAVETAKILNANITTAKVANSAITTTKLNNLSVTTAKLNDLAVTEAKIGSSAVTTAKVNNSAITEAKIGSAAVTEAKLDSGSVITAKIGDLAVTTIKLDDGSLTKVKFSTNLTPTEKVTALPTLPDSNYPEGIVVYLTTDSKLYRSTGSAWTKAVDGGDVSAGTVTANAIAAGTITAAEIATDTITANEIAAATITSSQIASATIVAANIAAGTITTSEIAANTIVAGNIAAGAVDTSELAVSSVTASKISVTSLDAVSADMGTLTAGEIAVGSITISADTERILFGSATAPLTGTGVFLGKDGADYEFRVGDPLGDYIHWDGSAFTISGELIGTTNLVDGAITEAKIGAGAVTTAKIGALAVTASELATDAVTNAKIAAGAVDTAELAGSSVSTAKLQALAVDSSILAADAVTSAKILAGAVDEAALGTAAVTTTKIGGLAVTTAKIAAGAVTTTELGSAAVTEAKIADASVATAKLQDSSVSTLKLASGSVTTAKIGSSAVTSTELASGSVTEAKIGSSAVTEVKVAGGAITTAKIGSLAVTTAKLADGSVSKVKFSTDLTPTEKVTALPTLPDTDYPEGIVVYLTTDSKLYRSTGSAWTKAVDGADLEAGTVTANAIAAGTITAAEIAADTLTASEIAAGAIATSELAAGAVTAAKIAAGTITASEIAAGTITTNEIAANTLVAGNIASATITAAEIASGTITANKINLNTIQPQSISAEAEVYRQDTAPSPFRLVPLGPYLTNLSGEYGIRIEEGDDYRVSAPSNWDADSFVISAWVQPDWDNGDGAEHYVWQAKGNNDNFIGLRKDTAGSWEIEYRINAKSGTKAISTNFAAGDAVYVEVRWDGTTLTISADNDDDGTLETATATPGTAFVTGLSWTHYIGQARNLSSRFEGAINLLITDDGSASDPGDDRFNSGNGMSLDTWLATVNDGSGGLPHAENLVLHVGGNSDGSSVQLDTFAGATKHIDPAGDGDFESDSNADGVADGWTEQGSGTASIEADPQTGSNAQAFSSSTNGDRTDRLEKSWTSSGADVWLVARTYMHRESGTGNATVRTGIGTDLQSTSSSYEQKVAALRETSGQSRTTELWTDDTGTEGRFDALAVYELATVSPSVEQRGVAPLWLDTSTTPNTWKKWDGSAWSPAGIKQGNIEINASTERILVGSATAPLTGAGVFIGKDGVDYEFRVGDPAGEFIHWDGSELLVGGIVTGGTIRSDSVIIGDKASPSDDDFRFEFSMASAGSMTMASSFWDAAESSWFTGGGQWSISKTSVEVFFLEDTGGGGATVHSIYDFDKDKFTFDTNVETINNITATGDGELISKGVSHGYDAILDYMRQSIV